MSVLQDLIEQLGPASVVDAVADSLRAFVAKDDFKQDLQKIVSQSYSLIGDKTAAIILAESGLGEEWRKETQSQIVSLGLEFIDTPAFSEWLDLTLD